MLSTQGHGPEVRRHSPQNVGVALSVYIPDASLSTAVVWTYLLSKVSKGDYAPSHECIQPLGGRCVKSPEGEAAVLLQAECQCVLPFSLQTCQTHHT